MSDLRPIAEFVTNHASLISVPIPLQQVVSRHDMHGPCGWVYVLACGHQYSEEMDGKKYVGQAAFCHVCAWWKKDDEARRHRYGTLPEAR